MLNWQYFVLSSGSQYTLETKLIYITLKVESVTIKDRHNISYLNNNTNQNNDRNISSMDNNSFVMHVCKDGWKLKFLKKRRRFSTNWVFNLDVTAFNHSDNASYFITKDFKMSCYVFWILVEAQFNLDLIVCHTETSNLNSCMKDWKFWCWILWLSIKKCYSIIIKIYFWSNNFFLFNINTLMKHCSCLWVG